MRSYLLALAVVAAALFCVTTSSAHAQDGCFGGGYGWGYDYGYLYNSLDYNVPYFAAHPPVYYSYPVPRTYGYSPFAYPPYVMTPEVAQQAEPVQIVNPYVPKTQKKSGEDRAASTKRRPEPLVIINPFLTPEQALAQSGG